jgi:hypothetical protein
MRLTGAKEEVDDAPAVLDRLQLAPVEHVRHQSVGVDRDVWAQIVWQAHPFGKPQLSRELATKRT